MGGDLGVHSQICQDSGMGNATFPKSFRTILSVNHHQSSPFSQSSIISVIKFKSPGNRDFKTSDCKACFLGSTLEPGRRPTLALRVARASRPIDVPLQALLQTQLRLPLDPRQHATTFLDWNLAAAPHNLEIYNPKNNPTAGYVVLPRYP